jgi:hypothetical protein
MRDEDGVPARGDQDDPSAPSVSGGGKVSRGKLGRLPPECSFAALGPKSCHSYLKIRCAETETQLGNSC